MDWGRFLRAVKAESIERIEDRRVRAIERPDLMSPEDWELIQAHDELVARYDTD